jgi:hypothetical protein
MTTTTFHSPHAKRSVIESLRTPREASRRSESPAEPQLQPGWREDRMVAFSLPTRANTTSTQSVRLPKITPRNAQSAAADAATSRPLRHEEMETAQA